MPHSRITIPTPKEAAAIKNKEFVSITAPSTIKTAENAANKPEIASCFVLIDMRKDLLPYIHTWCPYTTNHNTDYLSQNFVFHIHIPCFDTAVL